MESVKRSPVTTTQKKSRIARTFAKVLHIRAATGIAPIDRVQAVKLPENSKDNLRDDNRSRSVSVSQSFKEQDNEEKLRNRASMEALLAKLFASISSIKAAYAELQIAQSPYDADGIQSSDQSVVSELKILSELKQCCSKKQFDDSPETTLIEAEIQEQKSLLKIYEITRKNLESQKKLKDSETTFLREKLAECTKQNKLIDKRLSSSGLLSVLDNHQLSGLSPTHFITVLQNTIKSIRRFVRVMVNEMESANWDIDAAVDTIFPGVIYWKNNHKCFTFESFVCQEMFDAFNNTNFSLLKESLPDDQSRHKQLFFERFSELKSIKGTLFLSQNPKSAFAEFCRVKYLRLVHPKMEFSFFGELNQRNLFRTGEFPDSAFFTSFVEMAKHVWLLHCMAFSLKPEVSIFQVRKNCRFSEVYMESVADEAFMSPEFDPQVAFTVVPGFTIGKTIVQSLVYISKNSI